VIAYTCKYWNISVVSAVFIEIFQHNQQYIISIYKFNILLYDTLLPVTPCAHKLKVGIAYSSHTECWDGGFVWISPQTDLFTVTVLPMSPRRAYKAFNSIRGWLIIRTNLVPRAFVWGRGERRESPGPGRSILHSDWLTPYCLKITELDSCNNNSTFVFCVYKYVLQNNLSKQDVFPTAWFTFASAG
jgi:hypothetical protein